MPKIIFLDTYYPSVFANMPFAYSYKERQTQLGRLMFGTSDFYSHAFTKMGWKAEDLVVNDELGMRLLGMSPVDYIKTVRPDVLYCQDLSYLDPSILRAFKVDGHVKIIASQHSCPWAGDHRIKAFDIVFSSFPHYLNRIKELGVKTGFLPIAFGGSRVLRDIHLGRPASRPSERPYKISFVGGIGGGRTAGHWREGTDLLRSIASAFPEDFRWWGYGSDMLDAQDPLFKTFKGTAWGRSMYRVYSDSAIVINRHGEVAEGYSNNMRLFEATGLGSVLFTEASKNLRDYFNIGVECIAYDRDTIVELLRELMADPARMDAIAFAGQARTMSEHTYEQRLKPVEQIFRGMLNG